MSKYEKKALSFYEQGYNCAQAVLAAAAEDVGITTEQALRIASSFGGGMGGIKGGPCGALTALLMVEGLRDGYAEARLGQTLREMKAAQAKRTRQLAASFEEQCGALSCRELLTLIGKDEAWKKQPRPCSVFVACAARMLEEDKE